MLRIVFVGRPRLYPVSGKSIEKTYANMEINVRVRLVNRSPPEISAEVVKVPDFRRCVLRPL